MKRRVTLTLDDETAAMIKSLAARFGVSKSQVLSEAIRDFGVRPGLIEPEHRMPKAIAPFAEQGRPRLPLASARSRSAKKPNPEH